MWQTECKQKGGYQNFAMIFTHYRFKESRKISLSLAHCMGNCGKRRAGISFFQSQLDNMQSFRRLFFLPFTVDIPSDFNWFLSIATYIAVVRAALFVCACVQSLSPQILAKSYPKKKLNQIGRTSSEGEKKQPIRTSSQLDVRRYTQTLTRKSFVIPIQVWKKSISKLRQLISSENSVHDIHGTTLSAKQI